MFDFLSSDWFNIALEIVFVIFISYDIKKYIETKKREYIVNIALTIGFAIWTLYPFYKSYIGWSDSQKEVLEHECSDTNETILCDCINDKFFKNYDFLEYHDLNKSSVKYQEFITESTTDCLDDSWF